MDKYSNYFGIDISKDVFDVMDDNGNHKQYPNNPTGFKQFTKHLPANSCCVMEATGCIIPAWLTTSPRSESLYR